MTDAAPEPVSDNGGGPKAMSRVLRLMNCLAKAPEGLSLTDLAARLGAPKSTLLNSLRPLVAENFLQSEGSLYRLGPRAFRLAADIGSAWSLPRMLRGYLEQLAQSTGETAALGVLDAEMRRFVYVDVVESSQPVRYASRIGLSGPLYSTAAGRVLLAHQPQDYQDAYLRTAKLTPLTARTVTDPACLREQLAAARAQGWWESSGESVEGSAAIAAPVFGPDGRVIAALSVGAPSDRMTARRDANVAALVSAARRASGEVPEP